LMLTCKGILRSESDYARMRLKIEKLKFDQSEKSQNFFILIEMVKFQRLMNQ